jgi:hemerythrin-like domain-containing protein
MLLTVERPSSQDNEADPLPAEPDQQAQTFLADLVFEHTYLARILNAFEDHLISLRTEKSVNYGIIREVMHYIVHYPDTYHHPREHLLFERMLTRDPGLQDSVAKLEREHEIGYEQGRQLLALLEQAQTQPTPALSREILQKGERYTEGMRNHMRFEETAVIPHATELLSTEDWAEIRSDMRVHVDSLLTPPLNPLDHPGLVGYFEKHVKSIYTNVSLLEFVQSMIIIDSLTELFIGTRRVAELIKDDIQNAVASNVDFCKAALKARSPWEWWNISARATTDNWQRQLRTLTQLNEACRDTAHHTIEPFRDELNSLRKRRAENTQGPRHG